MDGVKSQPFGSSVANGNGTKKNYKAANAFIEFTDYGTTTISQVYFEALPLLLLLFTIEIKELNFWWEFFSEKAEHYFKR